MARGLFHLLLIIVLVMETHCINDTEVPTHIAHNKSITRKRNIAKREITCGEGNYSFSGQCCTKCKRGHVKSIDCPKTQEHCVPCKSGEEYMDHINDLDECMRCRSCDKALGLEVVKNCTSTENAECSCAKNHYCNSSRCEHCESCTVCENGQIEKECTSTSDTVCRMQVKRKVNNYTTQGNTAAADTGKVHSPETLRLIHIDVDLTHHVPDIVREMTLEQVMTFVRHHRLSEPTIEETLLDNSNNTSEQKIKLFQKWYQKHGMGGAYETLICSLRDLKMRTAADKIERKLKAAVCSHQERRESYNDKTEQSNTCSQEGEKCYDDNAEISKTYPESLEET
ncbi:tumor necrosis factor receptor superfamily member 6 precursor [Gallus gallus]|uniref:Tumor necrosis factor receptor superfamily member 6 n=1 Tax=Gallus gallus TaxID=9031 RepID=A0A8V0ZU18_CHICK|nr:tumor necrosis factor receptor superfamily member 6 precursor [Gallus gallus]